jgi:protein-S-isoprenylcysteine O-methyltransferase Ste14
MRPDKSYIISAVTGATSDPFFVRLGGWLFPRRTWIPYPLVGALLLIPPQRISVWWVPLGAAVVAAGEWLRIEAVRRIGVISRTRSERLGPLVDTGPFAWVRNPLYLGNIALWIGFSFIAKLPWLAPVFAALLLFEYHAIVSWEERLLAERIGDGYVEYARRVSRWVPRRPGAQGAWLQDGSRPTAQGSATFTWGETFFSERGTLIAIVLGSLLLWLKTRF